MDWGIYPHPLHVESRHHVRWSGKDWTGSKRGLPRDISASPVKNNAFISFLISLSSVYVKIQCLNLWSMSFGKIICKNAVPTGQELQFVCITKSNRWTLFAEKSVFILKRNKCIVWENGELFNVKAACYIQITTVLYSVILLTAEISDLTQKIVSDWLYIKIQKSERIYTLDFPNRLSDRRNGAVKTSLVTYSAVCQNFSFKTLTAAYIQGGQSCAVVIPSTWKDDKPRGGVWGWQVGRPPQAPLLRGSRASGLWVCQATCIFSGKLEMLIHAPFKILFQGQIP